MLKWLFGTKDGAAHADDHVWVTADARRRGVARCIAALVAEGRASVVVARDRAAFDETLADLAAHAPIACADVRGRSACRDALARAGSVVVALAGELPADLPHTGGPPVDLVVLGRAETRAADDVLAALADGLGARARLTFHLTLDDPVMPLASPELRELLAKLGVSDDEPIAHAFVTRAIANAQRQREG